MIALLGTIATLFIAFVLDNIRRQRMFAEAELQTPEPEQLVRSVKARSGSTRSVARPFRPRR
jgi:hypothetical protein